ncbi:hypothetical protein Vadar_024843 [Vaccinium darrowii]|uniref:Uncharacterized protein n=1 Tax=Vaccinium darrowii TaxID=229202 RepID=A0ACB7ZF23_9ERIC|nr:hypothetical protein Vadar_024843 [Vaccinium darrowii]
MKYVKTKQFNEVLRDFIFEELKIKSIEAYAIETANEICSAKGEWVLRCEGGYDSLLPYTLHDDYDKILILWHIATDLCYNTEKGNVENEKFLRVVVPEKEEKYSCLYNMYSPCLDASLASCCCHKCAAQGNEYRRRSNLGNSGHKLDMIIQACNSILDVRTEVNPSTV